MLYFVPLALVLGFVGGFFTFRVSRRWCPACGSTLRCADCPGRPLGRR